MSPRRFQSGLTTVEFSIVGLLFFIMLFTVFEMGRVFFVYNALGEATRRGARMAAVCQVNDPAIQEVAIFNASGVTSASGLVGGLTTANIQVNYLDGVGGTIPDPVADFVHIRTVQVQIVGFQHQLIIPAHFITVSSPDFRTTLPRESLGVSPDGFTPC